MADGSKIEWTDATWNIITGCSLESPGCTNCYAMKLAGGRLKNHPSRAGLTIDTRAGPVWNGRVRFNEEWLGQPRQWTKPRMIFVCAHGDIFHPDVDTVWLDKIFGEMERCHWHTFQILTKRSRRMRAYFSRRYIDGDAPRNIWAGVSIENQEWADKRCTDLMVTPASIRFLSCEPLLGPIDLSAVLIDGAIDWVIVGGESGRGARPMNPNWARDIRDRCAGAGIPFHFKQHGEYRQSVGPDLMAGQRYEVFAFPDHTVVVKFGKKAAGRLLDGVEHNGVPT